MVVVVDDAVVEVLETVVGVSVVVVVVLVASVVVAVVQAKVPKSEVHQTMVNGPNASPYAQPTEHEV